MASLIVKYQSKNEKICSAIPLTSAQHKMLDRYCRETVTSIPGVITEALEDFLGIVAPARLKIAPRR